LSYDQTTAGVFSTFVIGDYSPQDLIFDSLGNLYFKDNNNWPQDIKKVTHDGTVSIYANSSDVMYPNYQLFDSSDNLFFIDYDSNWEPKIKVILNPSYVCPTLSAPIASNKYGCVNATVKLSASGIGDLHWYDAPTGGTLVGSRSDFTTPELIGNVTYYVETTFCNATSSRTAVSVSMQEIPTATIIGTTSGNDYVALTASGGATYLWSGGTAANSASNVFTRSGTYTVTVSNLGGCSESATVTVVVNKMGVNKYGQLTDDLTASVNKNGTIGTINYVNKHGKNLSAVLTDGNLNYNVYTAPGDYAYDADGFSAFTDPANLSSSGTNEGAILLDWTDWSTLTNAGIAIPNNGERFAVVVTGFFVPSESGTYTFTCEGDDAVDLFINNTNVANHYGPHGTWGLGSHTGTIELIAGIKYPLRARMQENGGGEGLRVFWRKPSQSSGWYIDSEELSSQ
jgi:hypothetical protein